MDDKIIPIEWEVKFRVSPSLRSSETIADCRFEVDGKETFVTFRYTTSAFDEKIRDSEGEYEYTEDTKAKRAIAKIKRLMLERMVYQRVFQPIRVDIIRKPTPLNRKDIPNDKRTVANSICIKYSNLDVNDSIEESHNFWESGINDKTNDFLRIADWLQRSEEGPDEINSFICGWIGFNGLYNLFDKSGKKLSQPEKFQNAIKGLVKADDARRIVNEYSKTLDKLQSYNLKSQKNHDWSEELKNERQKRIRDNDVEIIMKSMNCIYEIRNRASHEAKEQKDLVDMVRSSKGLLIFVAATCLKNFINHQ